MVLPGLGPGGHGRAYVCARIRGVFGDAWRVDQGAGDRRGGRWPTFVLDARRCRWPDLLPPVGNGLYVAVYGVWAVGGLRDRRRAPLLYADAQGWTGVSVHVWAVWHRVARGPVLAARVLLLVGQEPPARAADGRQTQELAPRDRNPQQGAGLALLVVERLGIRRRGSV
eukprot:2501576-Rhodomonas_salina.2